MVAVKSHPSICWQYELGHITNFCELRFSLRGSLWELKTLYRNFKELIFHLMMMMIGVRGWLSR